MYCNQETIMPIKVDNLEVYVYPDRKEMGKSSGECIAAKIKELLSQQDELRMIFAAAPSQSETLKQLRSEKNIDWSRINVFNMDEYIGITKEHPASFSHFLHSSLFDYVHPKSVQLLNGLNNPAEECKRYAGLITAKPIDMVLLGIGDNGHIAFNEPSIANFDDREAVRAIKLDEMSRIQQVEEGCFQHLEEVPKMAVTITVPVIFSARFLFCMAPGENKHDAVNKVLNGPVSTNTPGSILRKHSHCKMFLDKASYGK